ncbi:MAG: RDD family protein [Magnetococcales bacterium]|nr:RDD family protein [Magnetococcales bacterium]
MFCSQCGVRNTPDANFCLGCGLALPRIGDAPAQPEHSLAIHPEIRYVGFWWRTLAAVIDLILCQALLLVIAFPLGLAMGVSLAGSFARHEIVALTSVVGYLVGSVVHWLWFTLGESSSWQGSPGKKMLGFKVVDEQGRRIGFGKANGRYWSKLLSMLLLFVGFIMVAFTERKQGLHDKIAGTFVVK